MEDCDLAIESTMILHTPKVQEMIEDLDIPVFIDGGPAMKVIRFLARNKNG